MKIWISRYQLTARHRLNRLQKTSVREGVLVRMEFPDGKIGYADLFVWPELGDRPLNEQLELLTQELPVTANLQRVLTHARLDAQARSQNQSLFLGLTIPPSHYLDYNGSQQTASDVERLATLGFCAIKIKWLSTVDTDRVIKLLGALRGSDLRLRVDFNFGLEHAEAVDFLNKIPDDLRPYFDYVEDPSQDPEVWRTFVDNGIPCALDRAEIANELPFSYMVVKPAISDPVALLNWTKDKQIKLVISSYMDHPVGQAFAAYWAAVCQSQSPSRASWCGLNSHDCYEESVYSNRLIRNSPQFAAPIGTGIGFDDLLAAENWTPLQI